MTSRQNIAFREPRQRPPVKNRWKNSSRCTNLYLIVQKIVAESVPETRKRSWKIIRRKISGERKPGNEFPENQQIIRTRMNKIAAAAMAAVVMDRGDIAPSENLNWQTWRAL
jgi:hypothetical protein